MKERKGFVFNRDGKTYARLQFTDENGKYRDLWRKADSKTHAKEILKNLIREIDEDGVKSLDASKLTFNHLADFHEKHYLKSAEYINGRKIAGVRSLKPAKSMLKTLREAFSKRPLKSISYGEIERFKQSRLKMPVYKNKERTIEKERSISSVNRELALLRRMLNVAVREKWISENPFNAGQPLISNADEIKRDYLLTHEEEQRMLDACTGKRKHLRPILIFLADTGCRLGEALKLRWSDVNFHDAVITIQAFNTKTQRSREIAITKRNGLALIELWEQSEKDPNVLVFGFTHHVRRAFNSARKEAGLPMVRLHDYRHLHCSRLAELGFSLSAIAHQAGHTQVQTTARYVNRNRDGVRKVAMALDAFNNGI
jgi:integrase